MTLRLLVVLVGFCASAQRIDLRQFDHALTSLSEKISPAVVQVISDAYSPISEMPGSPAAFEQAMGSGIVLSPDGYIVTNGHVVKGSRKIQVILPNSDGSGTHGSILHQSGRRLAAKLIGLDRESDLAVLKIDGKNLPHLVLADSDKIRQGQMVLAFGSPFGFQNSMAMGIVSAVARQLEADDPMIYIQSDVSINPGNSGGPMVDVEGNVIGVNTMIVSESGANEGVGLAVPSNIVRTVTEQIMKGGLVRRGEIGISAQTITDTMVQALGLPRPGGVLLADVIPGGPADRAGLRIGDIVLSLNGKVMENARQLQVNLYSKPVGSEVEVQLLRGERQTMTRSVKVSERPNDPERFAALVNQAVANLPQLGIMGLEMDDKVKELLPATRMARGILVANVLASAGRNVAALETGDIIYTVNRTAVTTLDEIKRALAKFSPGDVVVLQVEREEKLRYVEVTVD